MELALMYKVRDILYLTEISRIRALKSRHNNTVCPIIYMGSELDLFDMSGYKHKTIGIRNASKDRQFGLVDNTQPFHQFDLN